MEQGLIEVITGDGKGKTSAAVGLAVRASGAGLLVVFSQFLKNDRSSEVAVLRKINGINVISCEKLFGFIKFMDEKTLAIAKAYYREYFETVTKYAVDHQADVLILDEFIGAYNFDMIDREKSLEFLKNKPDGMELVLTGRLVPTEIAELADYISDIQSVRHPYDRGIVARMGIEM